MDVNPLTVHVLDIILIFITQLIHALDQVVALVCQISQLLIHGHFLGPVFDLLVPEAIQLIAQLPETVVGLVVLCFKALKVVGLPQQVGVYKFCLTLDLVAEVLLFSELG